MNLFYELVSAGLFKKVPNIDISIRLSDDEWIILFNRANEQAVVGLFIDGMSLMPEECKPSLDLRLMWSKAMLALENDNRNINQLAFAFSDIFKKNGLTPLLFKGPAIAYYYYNPLHRCCGDIDFVFWREYTKALDVTEMYEHSRNHEFTYDGYTIELHSRPEFFRSRFLDRRAEAYFDSWKNNYKSVEVKACNGATRCITIPSEEMAFCCMLLHVLRHCIESGIGMKQICDLAVIIPKVNNTDEVKRFINAFHLGYFTASLFGFLHNYLMVDENVFFVKPKYGYGYRQLEKIFIGEGYENFCFSKSKSKEKAISQNTLDGIKRLVRCAKLFPFLPEDIIAYPLLQLLNRLGLRNISIADE